MRPKGVRLRRKGASGHAHAQARKGRDMAFDFSGKTAIVTGGTQGIGLEIAKGIVEGGGHVVLIARSKEKSGIM